MNETRDSRLAAILARGLIRVRQGAGRPDQIQGRGDAESHATTAPKVPGAVHQPGETPAVGNQQGEQS